MNNGVYSDLLILAILGMAMGSLKKHTDYVHVAYTVGLEVNLLLHWLEKCTISL